MSIRLMGTFWMSKSPAIAAIVFRISGSGAKESGSAASSLVSVRIDDASLCPHYTARVIRGVKIGPSPEWLRARLESIELRPINNVVDVTNYVLFEMGQ